MSAAKLHTAMTFFTLSVGIGILSQRISESVESDVDPGENWEQIDSGQIDLVILYYVVGIMIIDLICFRQKRCQL